MATIISDDDGLCGRRKGGSGWRRGAAALMLALAATGLVTGSAARAAQAAEQGFVGKMEQALVDRLARRAGAAVDIVDTVYLVRTPSGRRARGDLGGIARTMAAATEGLVAALEASGQRVKYRARYAPWRRAATSSASTSSGRTSRA